MHSLIDENSNTSAEETRQQIDEAIKKYQDSESILALKYRRNSVASTSCFPPEILCRIFSFVQQEDEDEENEGEDEEDEQHVDGRLSHKWIKLTHVCRQWRNVAINSPTLWANPPLGNLSWAEEMLRRSKEASLVIKADISLGVPVTNALKLALKHGSRVKDLSIRSVNLALWNDLQEELPKSAPRLEFLCLRARPSEWFTNNPDDDEEEAWDPIPVSKGVLCKTQRLRHLELTNCEIDWTLPSFLWNSLTHLKLHMLPNVSKLSGKQFLEALKEMPNLEVLELNSALPVTMGTENVHLSSLRSLSIFSSTTEAELFFCCITFPPEAAVRVDCRASSNSSNDFSGVIAGLARSYTTPHRPTIAVLQVDPYIEVILVLSGGEDEDQQTGGEGYIDNTDSLLTLIFSWSVDFMEDRIATKIVDKIFNGGLPLQNVQGVYLKAVEDAKGPDPMAIANAFGRPNKVNTIMAEGPTIKSLFDALQLQLDPAAEDSKSAAPELYFPNLSSVYFTNTKFPNPDLPDLRNRHPCDLTFEWLRDVFIQRYESGAEIERLALLSCSGISEDDVDMLEEVVLDVPCHSIVQMATYAGLEIYPDREVDNSLDLDVS